MKKMSAFLALGGAVVLAACQRPSTNHAHGDHSARKPEPAQSRQDLRPAFSVPAAFRSSLGRVLEGYGAMQAALAEDDLPKAKEAFHAMHAILHMMPLDDLEPAARTYWDSTDARIMAVLHPLAASESLDSVRFHFMGFSAVMLDAVEKFGLADATPVFQFRCPMANGNRGAIWLQKGRDARNPYFGRSMPTCGERVKAVGHRA